MLIFDPSADSKQRARDLAGIGAEPAWIQIHTVDQFHNAFASLNRHEADLKRPLGMRLTDRFGEYWVEGTNAWHKVIAFRQEYCDLATHREYKFNWIGCGCVATHLCYHTARVFDTHVKLSQQRQQVEERARVLADKAIAQALSQMNQKKTAKRADKTLASS